MSEPNVIDVLRRAQALAFEAGEAELWSDIETILAATRQPVSWWSNGEGTERARVDRCDVVVRRFGEQATWTATRMELAPSVDEAKEAAVTAAWGIQ